MKKVVVLVAMVLIAMSMAGCEQRQSTVVSHNVSKEADNFNVVRRVTVINTRTDKCILQMVGKISIQDVSHGIAVGVSKYAYEIEFMPQTLIPVHITANELKQDLGLQEGD